MFWQCVTEMLEKILHFHIKKFHLKEKWESNLYCISHYFVDTLTLFFQIQGTKPYSFKICRYGFKLYSSEPWTHLAQWDTSCILQVTA